MCGPRRTRSRRRKTASDSKRTTKIKKEKLCKKEPGLPLGKPLPLPRHLKRESDCYDDLPLPPKPEQLPLPPELALELLSGCSSRGEYSPMSAPPHPMFPNCQTPRTSLDQMSTDSTSSRSSCTRSRGSKSSSPDPNFKTVYRPPYAVISATDPLAFGKPRARVDEVPINGTMIPRLVFNSIWQNDPATFNTCTDLARYVRRQKWGFVCPTCGKTSVSMSMLINHCRTHSGRKPYYCPIKGCKYSTAVKANLKQHLRSVAHGGVETLRKWAPILDMDTEKPIHQIHVGALRRKRKRRTTQSTQCSPGDVARDIAAAYGHTIPQGFPGMHSPRPSDFWGNNLMNQAFGVPDMNPAMFMNGIKGECVGGLHELIYGAGNPTQCQPCPLPPGVACQLPPGVGIPQLPAGYGGNPAQCPQLNLPPGLINGMACSQLPPGYFNEKDTLPPPPLENENCREPSSKRRRVEPTKHPGVDAMPSVKEETPEFVQNAVINGVMQAMMFGLMPSRPQVNPATLRAMIKQRNARLTQSPSQMRQAHPGGYKLP